MASSQGARGLSLWREPQWSSPHLLTRCQSHTCSLRWCSRGPGLPLWGHHLACRVPLPLKLTPILGRGLPPGEHCREISPSTSGPAGHQPVWTDCALNGDGHSPWDSSSAGVPGGEGRPAGWCSSWGWSSASSAHVASTVTPLPPTRLASSLPLSCALC